MTDLQKAERTLEKIKSAFNGDKLMTPALTVEEAFMIEKALIRFINNEKDIQKMLDERAEEEAKEAAGYFAWW